jgi:hypothetical protein
MSTIKGGLYWPSGTNPTFPASPDVEFDIIGQDPKSNILVLSKTDVLWNSWVLLVNTQTWKIASTILTSNPTHDPEPVYFFLASTWKVYTYSFPSDGPTSVALNVLDVKSGKNLTTHVPVLDGYSMSQSSFIPDGTNGVVARVLVNSSDAYVFAALTCGGLTCKIGAPYLSLKFDSDKYDFYPAIVPTIEPSTGLLYVPLVGTQGTNFEAVQVYDLKSGTVLKTLENFPFHRIDNMYVCDPS